MRPNLSTVRLTMWGTVIPRMESPGQATPAEGDKGRYEIHQDPDSGLPITVWVADNNATTTARYDIRCYARGYTNLGFRSSGNRETYEKGVYDQIESIQLDYPKNVVLSHQSYVTNIRQNKSGTEYLWVDFNTGLPVVWEVQGVTPVLDPFGKLQRYTTVLKRAEIQ